jgi:enterochelin esterase-like enzyme
VRKRVSIAATAVLLLAFPAAVGARSSGVTARKVTPLARLHPAVPGSAVTPLGDTVVGAAAGLPTGWVPLSVGPAGGAVWSGLIPNSYAPHEGASAVYLPPHFSAARRYPVLYLLHGLSGSPASYYAGLHLAQVADAMITSGQIQPMVIAMPAGANSDTAEWAGRWEAYIVRDVVPWVDGYLPTIASPAGRALGGLCAGGYGAMDIGLRHADLFGTLESWEGYFAPVFRDGPFVHASQAYLNANDPSLILQKQAAMLRTRGVRFYISVGGNHGHVLRQWSLDFSSLLDRLRIPHTLWQAPAAQRREFWRATMPSALQFASDTFTHPTA